MKCPSHAAHWCSPQVPMATMSTSLAATARMFPVAYRDFGPVTGTAATCRFCQPRTLAHGRCTDGSTLPGSTGRRTRTHPILFRPCRSAPGRRDPAGPAPNDGRASLPAASCALGSRVEDGRAGRSLPRVTCGPRLVHKEHDSQVESTAWSMARLSDLYRLD